MLADGILSHLSVPTREQLDASMYEAAFDPQEPVIGFVSDHVHHHHFVSLETTGQNTAFANQIIDMVINQGVPAAQAPTVSDLSWPFYADEQLTSDETISLNSEASGYGYHGIFELEDVEDRPDEADRLVDSMLNWSVIDQE